MRENGTELTSKYGRGDSFVSPGASVLRRGGGDGTLDRRASAVTTERRTRTPRPAAPNRSTSRRTVVGQLTRREKEILRCLSQGMSTAAIAERLFIARVTVRNHVQHILQKLGMHSRLAAVLLARRLRLI